MNNKKMKKVVSVSLASALTMVNFVPGFAAVDKYVLEANDSTVYEYQYTDLSASYTNSLLGLGDTALYDHYQNILNNGGSNKAILDTVSGYVDYSKVSTAYIDSVLNGQTFDINSYTETQAPAATMPNTVKDVTVDNGTIVETDKNVGQTGDLAVSSVSAITTTKIQVELSKAVDDATAANFAIAGLTVTSATLDANKKTVTLVTNPAKPQAAYTLTVTGLKINAVVQDDMTKDFTMPAVNTLYSGTTLEYADEDGTLKADGATSTLVTFTLKDAEGTILTDAEDVVVSFTSTFGNFGEKRVTVQNGIATVMFTSEALSSARTADLVGTVVEAKDTNLYGIKADTSLTLDPNPDDGTADTAGARVTEAEAAQADRVIIYFNKEVTVEKYTTADDALLTRVIDTDKATVFVTKSVNNDLTGGTPIDVKGFLPVEGNTKALQVLLDVDAAPGNALADNAKVKVQFTDKTGTVDVPSTVGFNLTDARKPEMVRVDREGLKTIKVTFSEPITDATAAISASTLTNWSVDGKLLSDTKWGVAGTEATAVVGTFDPYTMEDTRNVVTITLGKRADSSQIYFPAGTHSVQGANIGDWAAESDTINNKMNTQTLDFDIPVDTEAPTAAVEVQSPEQWLVTFNKDVDETAVTFASKFKLQKLNTTTGEWANDTDVTSYGVAKVSDDNLNLVVKQVADNKFLIETDIDWTNVHNTATSNKNYYNYQYRLHIPADTVTNPANGMKNAEQFIELNGDMDTPDIDSPVISTIVETPGAVAGTSYRVTMSEPVKLETGANTEGATDSESQGYTSPGEDWDNIPTPTARFIKADNSLTIPGTVASTFVAPADPGTEYERILTVTPQAGKTLTAGDWILSVESISDDVGNTAATATQQFTVTGSTPVDQDFKVAWAYADKDSDITDPAEYDKDNVDAGTADDAVYVKFTKPVKITGDFVSALETQNYTLNGKALPDGTQIVTDIAGYDDHDSAYDSVTIILPDNTITDTETTVLNVTSFIQSTDGTAIANPGEKKLSYEFESTTVSTSDELKAALADTGVRKITLGGNIPLGESLTVDRLVDIDLAGFGITAGAFDLEVATTETGRMIISNSGGAETIDKLDIDAANADFVVGASVTITALTVNDLYSSTLINDGTIVGLTLNDSTSIDNNNAITNLTVETGNTLTLDNATGTIDTLTNNGSVTVEMLGTITNPIGGTGTVTGGSSISDADSVALAKAALDATDLTFQAGETYQTVKGDIVLPTSGEAGTTITWTEEGTGGTLGAIAGSVVGISRDASDDADDTYVLTATITKGVANDTKDVTLTVVEGGAPTVASIAANIDKGANTLTMGTDTIVITFSEAVSDATKAAVNGNISATIADDTLNVTGIGTLADGFTLDVADTGLTSSVVWSAGDTVATFTLETASDATTTLVDAGATMDITNDATPVTDVAGNQLDDTTDPVDGSVTVVNAGN